MNGWFSHRRDNFPMYIISFFVNCKGNLPPAWKTCSKICRNNCEPLLSELHWLIFACTYHCRNICKEFYSLVTLFPYWIEKKNKKNVKSFMRGSNWGSRWAWAIIWWYLIEVILYMIWACAKGSSLLKRS